jgi:glutaredoxin
MALQAVNSARIQVFWQPGCSSCLRTKEFLKKQGIEFESIDVLNDEDGMEKLQALGAKSVPVVALGGRYTLCQSFNDVIKFLDLKTKFFEPLPPEELLEKIKIILPGAQRMVVQFSKDQLNTDFRDRNRTPGGTAFHVFKVAQMGIEAASKIELVFEGFNEMPPKDWTAQDISNWGREVLHQVVDWWAKEPQRKLDYLVPTYYGQRTMHDVLERTAWHCAQHTRQLALMLEEYGIVPNQPLTVEDLKGLPVPDAVWDR